jgi:hypothetical protein
MTENMAKPCACHDPIIVISWRHDIGRGMTPPMKRADGSSVIISANASRSSRRGGRRIRRGVSICNESMSIGLFRRPQLPGGMFTLM